MASGHRRLPDHRIQERWRQVDFDKPTPGVAGPTARLGWLSTPLLGHAGDSVVPLGVLVNDEALRGLVAVRSRRSDSDPTALGARSLETIGHDLFLVSKSLAKLRAG
jgi:hypothetical protein